LPVTQQEEAESSAVELLYMRAEQNLAIEQPDADDLPAALESVEAREGVILQWLEAYRSQLGSTPFSVRHFMTAAQARLADLNSDNDFALGPKDYEHIKTWVFEALAAGTLTQVFDDAGNRIELKAVLA
jgi:type I restriction enzyme S subunit